MGAWLEVCHGGVVRGVLWGCGERCAIWQECAMGVWLEVHIGYGEDVGGGVNCAWGVARVMN